MSILDICNRAYLYLIVFTLTLPMSKVRPDSSPLPAVLLRARSYV